MSTSDSATAGFSEASGDKASTGRWSSFLDRVESVCQRIGDRLNPILVKEARQALKSKQFVMTFALLLICGWTWSLIGVISQMPDIYYAPSGLWLLIGYYVILAVPLLLIVPFSAFRSLASEREDGTYELLSISTLSSRQIVTGKLGSALLQMMVYYSALAPCIAFTYMLRGVDLITIALLLFYTFMLSVTLCCVGLVFAGLSRSRHWQTLISVVLLLALVIVGVIWFMGFTVFVNEGIDELPLDNTDFWLGQLTFITANLTYIALFIAMAASQNSFASDNRSTRIRLVVFIQSALFVGWVAFWWFRYGDEEIFEFACVIAAVQWLIYGVFMSGESAKLSPRVRRELPMSFMGRVFLTWFNPGSGTGYIFAVTHVLVLSALACVAVVVQRDFNFPGSQVGRTGGADHIILFCVLYAAYFCAYIGFSRLVLMLIPRREQYGFLLPFLINVLFILAGASLPVVFESWRNNYNRYEYSEIQTTNWWWTLNEAMDHGNANDLVMFMVGTSGVLILLVNLVVTRAEIEAVRVEAPDRVKEDDLQRAPPVEAAGPKDPFAPDDSEAAIDPAS